MHLHSALPVCGRAIVLLLLTLPSVAALAADDGPAGGYVGSDDCASCHADAAAAWSRSHHAAAWTATDSRYLEGDFDDSRFELDGMTARFSRLDGAPRVEVEELDGQTTTYPIHSVVGIEPLQQYLIETEPGRLQSFDVVWNTEQGGWFHLYPDQELPPDDALHWTGPYKNWNARCAECHATGYAKNYDREQRTYASTQAEIGVGCEACHGPGHEHVELARSIAQGSAASWPEAYGFPVDLSDGAAAIEQCAGCHSRREGYVDGNPVPGTPYHDAYNLALLRPGLYFADGQILEEVYVHGSFLQSKMYAQGVDCQDCHRPHDSELLADGNAVCTQCHSPAGNPRFPSLAKAAYDTSDHHYHPVEGPAGQCTSCHMPERVYMGNDWRADHSFRVPRPDLNAETGAPDACTGCHADQAPDWAAAQLVEWYPDSVYRGAHFGTVLARGRENPAAAANDLATLALDPEQPGIVRATALELLQNAGDAEAAERVASLLEDEDPLVRASAVVSQRAVPGQQQALRLVGLLDDPSRSVRMAAARALLGAPIARFPEAISRDFGRAMGEVQAAYASRLDFPESHLQLAGIGLTTRNLPAAIGAFREVVALDPQRVEAWRMLVRLAAATEGAEAAAGVLEEALRANPDHPVLQSLKAELDEASS